MIKILRLGHRLGRDKRVSTHLGLVARAFGGDEIIFSGDKDKKLMKNLEETKKTWGGNMKIEYEKNWRKLLEEFDGKTIHLTMYGEKIQDKIEEIRKHRNLLIIAGGKKVPGELYGLADYNIAITNQPHSEVASLAVFLDKYFQGKELDKKFEGGKFQVRPKKSGKEISEK